MTRPRGRPQTEYAALDKELQAFGGLKTFVQSLDANDETLSSIVERLAKVGGVKVTRQTVRTWIARWESEDKAKEEVAA